jgi:hypothetical protein
MSFTIQKNLLFDVFVASKSLIINNIGPVLWVSIVCRINMFPHYHIILLLPGCILRLYHIMVKWYMSVGYSGFPFLCWASIYSCHTTTKQCWFLARHTRELQRLLYSYFLFFFL